MTDLLPDPEPQHYSLPASSRSKRFNRAAVGCLLLMIPLTLLLIETHPRVPTIVSAFLVGLPVMSVMLVVLGRKKDPVPEPSKKSLGGALISVGVVVLLLVFLGAILSAAMCRPRESSNRARCASNLRQIAVCLMAYADAHDGTLPATLDVLITEPGICLSPAYLVCPSCPDERAEGLTPELAALRFRDEPHHLSYVYLGAGQSNTMTSGQVLMYEHSENHKSGGMNVLFGDGHADFLPLKDAERRIAESAAAHVPPASRN